MMVETTKAAIIEGIREVAWKQNIPVQILFEGLEPLRIEYMTSLHSLL
jgi:hypothetical protein